MIRFAGRVAGRLRRRRLERVRARLFRGGRRSRPERQLRKGKRRGSRDAACAKDEDAAPGELELLFERAQDADVVGVGTEERTVALDDDGVDGADLRGERVALLQMLQDGLLVRDGHAEPANAELGHSLQKVAKILDQERQVDGIDFASDETRIMKERRQGVADGIADYAIDASRWESLWAR